MMPANATFELRHATDATSVIVIRGEVTAFAESQLMDAYNRATGEGARAIILNFAGLDYMNSSGIGLLVTLLIRANRAKVRLLAVELKEHYRHIFELTRLNEAIRIFDTEADALAALSAF